MPTPPQYLAGKKVDRGVMNIRQTTSSHWRAWLGPEHRCLVPFTSFAENEEQPDGSKPPVWFAFDESRPLAFFAGIWATWTSVRKVKEGPVTAELFGFLTSAPNAEVAAVHPKAMPVILTGRRSGRRGWTRRGLRRKRCSGRCRMARCALYSAARRRISGRRCQIRR